MVLEPLGSNGESMDTHRTEWPKSPQDRNLPPGITAKLWHSVGAPSGCTLSTNSSDLNTTRQLLARLKAQDIAPLFHIPLWHSQLPKHTTLLCPAGFTDLPILCLLKLLWEISSKINVLSQTKLGKTFVPYLSPGWLACFGGNKDTAQKTLDWQDPPFGNFMARDKKKIQAWFPNLRSYASHSLVFRSGFCSQVAD